MLKIGSVSLPKQPLLLAPMEDVSDPPFRKLCKKFGADLLYTEFISTEGLIRNADKSVQKLDIYPEERPIGIQIFGAELDSMLQATDIVEKANPEIIDINFGCPVKKVVCKGAGAGILQDITKMVELTKAIVERTHLPVTVKTRLGWDENTIRIVEVAERLQDVGIKAISIHGRTRKQMYKGEARWEPIADVKNNPRMHIPVFANGDINSPQRAKEVFDKWGFDGAMIGRATIGNPWFFREVKHFFNTGKLLSPPTVSERIEVVLTHLKDSIEWKGERAGINEMKRHYASYFRGLKDTKCLKSKLMNCQSFEEIENAIYERFSLDLKKNITSEKIIELI